MPWQAYCIIGWFLMNLVISIALIGREVKLTPGGAVINLAVYSFLTWCVYTLVN